MPNCILHLPGGGVAHGPGAIGAVIEAYHKSFSAARWTIHDIIVSPDRVVVRTSGESRYIGGWHGIEASDQLVREACINIFRFADNRIIEVWFEVSDLDVAKQLGAFPATTLNQGKEE